MTSDRLNRDIFEICHLCRIMPILTIEEEGVAVPIAKALYSGGIKVMEITLRTPFALDAIRSIRQELPEMIVGAGTILTQDDLELCYKAGAQFGVSPGSTDGLLRAVEECGLPFLPGANSPTEMMRLVERNFLVQKFFPAEQCGGTAFLKAVFGPLPQISFFPTGGITPELVSGYLDLVNVTCIGCSWIAPKDAVKERNWGRIKELAIQASGY